jgi:hypothetical protein
MAPKREGLKCGKNVSLKEKDGQLVQLNVRKEKALSIGAFKI